MYTPSFLIQKKRDGKSLETDEIQFFIEGLQSGVVTDYQATAFLMATYFQGMTLDETVFLTQAMLNSGQRYDLSKVSGPKVDKHSTGGVGDKVSLILSPLAAACGLKVPMMSGRGLGHSGGTLDKLESIPGFRVQLNAQEFETVLQQIGCAMMGQTEEIVPADKKLYALRDVTATVECIPLITASILSKKLAEGAQALVLDVKVGSGAFMKTKRQAKLLAKTLTQVAKKMQLPCCALLTNMDQPLGYSVGHILEMKEAIEVLKNEKNSSFCSADLKELTLHLCAHMLQVGGLCKTLEEGRKRAQAQLSNGKAWQIFCQLVEAQGGHLPSKFPQAPIKTQWKAKKRGFINRMNTEEIGKILIELGGGRKKASDAIDLTVGLAFHKKLGKRVHLDEPIVDVYAPQNLSLSHLERQFHQALEISPVRKPVPALTFENYSTLIK